MLLVMTTISKVQSYNCAICGSGSQVTNLNGELVLPGRPTKTCLELLIEGAEGKIDELNCAFINIFTPEVCMCQPLASTESGQSVLQVPDIVSIVTTAGTFTQFLNALEVTGLVDDFYGPGGLYTVFVPLEAAFDALPEGMLDILLQPENVDVLTDILLYHIVSREVYSTDLMTNLPVETREGSTVTVNSQGGQVTINTARVVTTDILASNGVIHVLDQLLLPDSFLEILPKLLINATGSNSTDLDIPTIATLTGTFDVLLAALNATDLIDALSEPDGPFTIFAPVDAAFEALPAGVLDQLLTPPFLSLLADVLLYHVVNGTYTDQDLTDGLIMTTLNGDTVTLSMTNASSPSTSSFLIDDALILDANIIASNGVIHAISKVLLPPGFAL